jgi:hypothetical protein
MVPTVRVQITEWVSDDQPGFVRCVLRDAANRTWSFVEKAPVVSAACLWNDTSYPQPGVIACEIMKYWRDDRGRDIVTMDTDRPWGIAAEAGGTVFDVLRSQVDFDATIG